MADREPHHVHLAEMRALNAQAPASPGCLICRGPCPPALYMCAACRCSYDLEIADGHSALLWAADRAIMFERRRRAKAVRRG